MTIAGSLVVGDLLHRTARLALSTVPDEVDPEGNLIKGRGGALFREKLMFRATEDRRVIVDSSKSVVKLGSKFPVPVEVVPRRCRRSAELGLGANGP
jgi:ribose 5-phosphate isomerase